jgi:UDP-N-acetylmuramoyl-L-alanyl-D-glutamate--2,6-diaminopimelate ligase
MLEKTLRITKRLIPKKVFIFFQPAYHFLLATIGALIYKFPSKKISVVGVTGTKGKTTTTEIITSILEAAGLKVALVNSIRFKIGEKEERNKYKMSMPGRFFMQNFIKKAVDEKCDWVVIEMTSEGSKQFRHKWIYLDSLVFTNLAPEHIESHGSFEKYKEAKLALTETLKNKNKETFLIVNEEDKASEDFLKKEADHKIKYSIKDLAPIKTDSNGIEFRFGESTIFSKLHGTFNANNILAAAVFAQSIGIFEDQIKKGIENVKVVPGRVEMIINEPFEVYVDYAHTPDSLEALYKSFPNQQKICVLGGTGGGRDHWKRSEMAKIADKYCDQIFLTDEDPYDEDPEKIVREMEPSIKNTPVEIIMDRRMAINKGMRTVKKGGVVLITGKGTDPYIMRANGDKEPWSDADVVREEYEIITSKNL